MTGDGKGGLYPPPEHAVFLEPPLTREPPINGQDERLRLCIDQFAEASAIGNAKPSDGGVFLILVIALTDLGPSPIQVDPGYLSLATPGGEPLRPQSSGFRSAIEKFHAQTIYPQHGTVGMVVFTLPAPDAFEQLIYNDGVGNPLILPLTP